MPNNDTILAFKIRAKKIENMRVMNRVSEIPASVFWMEVHFFQIMELLLENITM